MVRVNRDFDMFEVDLKATLLQTAKIAVHPDWYPCIEQAFAAMDPDYLLGLEQSDQWLPERQNMLMAFSQPLSAVRYVLLGESPYPRKQSARQMFKIITNLKHRIKELECQIAAEEKA